MNALPKGRQENLWVEQEIKVVPISAFAWAGAGSVPGAVQLLLPSQVFSFQKQPLSKWPGCCGQLQTSVLCKGSVFLYRRITFSALLTKGCLEIIRKN